MWNADIKILFGPGNDVALDAAWNFGSYPPSQIYGSALRVVGTGSMFLEPDRNSPVVHGMGW